MIRPSSKTGDPHLSVSFAPGTTFFSRARISRNCSCASLGAALIYSLTVVGFVFGMDKPPYLSLLMMPLLQFGKFDDREIINLQYAVSVNPYNKNILTPHIVDHFPIYKDFFGFFWIPNFNDKLLSISKTQCIHIPDLGKEF